MGPVIKLCGKLLDDVAGKVADDVVEYAEKNWKHLFDEDGYIHIDQDQLVDQTLEQIIDAEELAHSDYAAVFQHPAVQAALKEAKILAEDAAENAASWSRMWTGSVYEQLREVGMKVSDFL